MSTDRKAFHKAEYLKYSVDELAMITDQIVSDPVRYTLEARDALREALAERNLDAGVLLRNLHAEELRDSQTAISREQKKKTRSKKSTRILGLVIGFIGIPMSILVGGLSIAQAHLGGLIASAAWFISSIWMAFYYQETKTRP